MDNAHWPTYLVFLGDYLIGKSFSRPSLSDAEWLEVQQREQTMYAYSSARLPELSKRKTGERRSIGEARSTRRKRTALALAEG